MDKAKKFQSTDLQQKNQDIQEKLLLLSKKESALKERLGKIKQDIKDAKNSLMSVKEKAEKKGITLMYFPEISFQEKKTGGHYSFPYKSFLYRLWQKSPYSQRKSFLSPMEEGEKLENPDKEFTQTIQNWVKANFEPSKVETKTKVKVKI